MDSPRESAIIINRTTCNSLVHEEFSVEPAVLQAIKGVGLSRISSLSTSRLVIRPFRRGDEDALYQLHRDPEVMRYAGGTKTRADSRLALHRLVTRVQRTGLGALAVQEKGDKEVIGWCGIQKMRDIGAFEVVYALLPTKWGFGLAQEAAAALIMEGFAAAELNIDRIHGLVFPQNLRSIRVLEKLGMRFVRNHCDRTGRHACLYGVHRDEFADQSSSKK